MNKNRVILIAAIYFILSTIITWWFVVVCPLYTCLQQELLSTGIAGAKWSLQIAAALLLLKNKKWDFVQGIGRVCLVGSVILLPYSILASWTHYNSGAFFTGSLIVAVLSMIALYFLTVQKLQLSYRWFWGWIICLCIAISLQLTVVFQVIKL